MFRSAPGRRTLRRCTGAMGAVALVALTAGPAAADDPAPGLVLGGIAPIDGVRPGGTVPVTASFTNTGAEALAKVYLSYSVTRGLSHTELPSNCLRYEVSSFDEEPGKSVAVCEFDQRVEPGTVYAPERALNLKALDHALYDDLRVVVAVDDPAPGDGAAAPVRGTGPALRLAELPDATPAPGGAAEHPGRDAAEVRVTSVNTADFRVTGAALKGRAGDTVGLEVRFTNDGPGWVLRDLGTPATEVRVTMPAGTTVTKTPGFCDKVRAGTYTCGTAQSWVDEGGGETYAFRLRIDKAVPGAEGSVKLAGAARPFDEDKSDDSARIVLDVTGGSTGGTGGSAGGSTGGSAGGSSGGDGGSGSTGSTGSSGSTGSTGSTGSSGGSATTPDGSLASTGSGSALPLAGAAAGAVAIGAGAVFAARRRANRR